MVIFRVRDCSSFSSYVVSNSHVQALPPPLGMQQQLEPQYRRRAEETRLASFLLDCGVPTGRYGRGRTYLHSLQRILCYTRASNQQVYTGLAQGRLKTIFFERLTQVFQPELSLAVTKVGRTFRQPSRQPPPSHLPSNISKRFLSICPPLHSFRHLHSSSVKQHTTRVSHTDK